MKLLSILFLCTVVSALATSYVELDTKPHAKLGYTQVGRSAPNDKLVVQIALTHHNTVEMFEEVIMTTSLPHKTRDFLSDAEVRDLYKPLDVDIVIDWLRIDHSVAASDIEVINHGDWLQVSLSVSQAEEIFRAQFHDYTHPVSGTVVFKRTERYYVAAGVAPFIDFVAIKRLHSMKSIKRSSKTAKRQSLVGPSQVRKLFGIPSSIRGSKTNGNLQSIASFLGQFYSTNDLHAFERNYNLPTANVTTVGPNQQRNPGVEAELDVQQITGVNQGTPTIFHSTGGTHDQQEPFLVWLTAITGDRNGPKTHSVSYGDVESSLDDSFIHRVNIEFMKLGAIGHTFIVASGDSGVTCSNNGQFQEPDFPASSPYVTAVGGGVLTGDGIESWGGSGGGFSRKFPRPAFMQSAQEAYINNHNQPPHSYYNTSGRGYPDVSGVSLNVAVFFNGQEIDVGGTSCAAPQFSGLVSLLKDAQISKGGAPLGYLNPLIYSWADQAFSEITQGPPNSSGNCPGFSPVQRGWDPLNGFGILDYTKAVALLH